MEEEFLDAVKEFGGHSFSTLDFCKAFEAKHRKLWANLVAKYGAGGKGAGSRYTAYSYVSQILNKLFNAGLINKLDYRPAPAEYGNPWIRYWSEDDSYQEFPDEIRESEPVIEGAKTTVTVNRYERNRNARAVCIEKHGIICSVCEFNFEETYGKVGAGFIHVHHVKPLGELGEEYELDPARDLMPVCPNCHAMLHRKSPALSISELKKCITKSSSRRRR